MDLKSLGDTFLPIVKDLGAQLWDGPEDVDLMKFIAQDSARIAVAAAKGADVSEEFAILKEVVRQRAAQKVFRASGLREETFWKILEGVVKVVKTIIL